MSNFATLKLTNRTVSENTASVGGGIYNCPEGQTFDFFGIPRPCRGTLTLKNSIVSENTPDNIFPW